MVKLYLNGKMKAEMPRQLPSTPIRRCLGCYNKTHRRFWETPECPVCSSSIGYAESTHGALLEKEMKERAKMFKSKKGKERL